VNKITSILSIVLLVIFVIGLLIFGLSKSRGFQHFIFYKTGLVPKELFLINEEISKSTPLNINQERLDLFQKVDDLVKSSMTGKTFSAKPYSLIKIQLDQAYNEIAKETVPQGIVKVWYLYNMGIIAKSSDKTIAFDLANQIAYYNIADFTKLIDVLVITHFHGDHFDSNVVKYALKNNVKVVVPDEKVVLFQEGNSKFIIKNPNGENIATLLNKLYGIKSDNLILAKPKEKLLVNGIEITGYPATHNYNLDSNLNPNIALSPIDWFFVNFSGLNFLHTSDGISQESFSTKKIDVLIAHLEDGRSADSLASLIPSTKFILPLHVLELQHGSGILNYMMYKNALDENTDGQWKSNISTKFVPLFWGESISLNK
jgi:hypothetical protein